MATITLQIAATAGLASIVLLALGQMASLAQQRQIPRRTFAWHAAVIVATPTLVVLGAIWRVW